jgi:LPXTG-motif cell wall-anchored protein
MKTVIRFLALSTVCLSLAAASDSQQIAIQQALQIPGEVLQPGTYRLSLEDRLTGRAIVRIANTSTGRHSFLLTVPSSKIAATAANKLILFTPQDGNRILRAWLCPDCAKPLEMVYPKADAVKITADTGESVLAADPGYDKLPAALSPDDMKVVTLWLLAPERISNGRGVGLKAAKYILPPDALATPNRSRLPQTASNAYSFAALGLLLLLAFAALRVTRLKSAL